MSQSTLILGLSVAYLGLLFVVAHFGERHAPRWSHSRAGPIIYALSLAIYCTSWTFYGAVGRAATVGLDFVLIYVGPALVMLFGWPVDGSNVIGPASAAKVVETACNCSAT